MDTESLMIFSLGIPGSDDSVPWNVMMETIDSCDNAQELRQAVQEVIFIASGMAITMAGMLNEDLPEGEDPVTPMEVVELQYKLMAIEDNELEAWDPDH